MRPSPPLAGVLAGVVIVAAAACAAAPAAPATSAPRDQPVQMTASSYLAWVVDDRLAAVRRGPTAPLAYGAHGVDYAPETAPGTGDACL